MLLVLVPGKQSMFKPGGLYAADSNLIRRPFKVGIRLYARWCEAGEAMSTEYWASHRVLKCVVRITF